MPLTIPNSADAAFGAQSEPDSRDFDAIVAAMGGTCVLAGCAVTAQGVPNMTVAVAAGTIASSTTVASVTGGNATIAANASGNPRFDLIVTTSAGALAVRQGTAAVNPVFPTLTAGDVMLASVWVPNGAASIATNQIVDKRGLVDYPTANPVALGAAANSGTALTVSLSDHVHPTTGLAVLASNNTFTGGSQTISPAAGGAGFTINAASTGSSTLVWSEASTAYWQIYRNTGDPRLYVRDLVNSKMVAAFLSGGAGASGVNVYESLFSGGVIQMTGNLGLPAGSNGAQLLFAAGFSSPVSGRIYIGDGTGWQLRMSTRTASTDSDRFTFDDRGVLTIANVLGNNPLVITMPASTGTTATHILMDAANGGYGGGFSVRSRETGTSTQIVEGSIEIEGETNWASVANANSFIRFSVAVAGTLTEKMRLSSAQGLILQGSSGVTSDLTWSTSSLARRWLLRKDAVAESGSNVGSNLNLFSFDDAGTTLLTVMAMTRSSGLVTFGSSIAVTTQATVGTNRQTAALVSARNAGNSYEFGHSNPAGYGSTIGALNSNGSPFVAFSAENDAGNTFQTRGLSGVIIMRNAATNALEIGRVTSASASGQTPVLDLAISNIGTFGFGVAARSDAMLTSFAFAHPGTPSGGNLYGALIGPTLPATTTGTYYGYWSRTTTTAAAFALAAGIGYYAETPTLGAGSTISGAQTGFYAGNQGVSGVAQAEGIRVVGQSGATVNIGIRAQGASHANIWLDNDTASGASGIVFGTARDFAFYRNNSTQATLTARLEVISSAGASQVRVGVSTADTGGYLLSTAADNMYMAAGTAYSGTQWIAKYTSAAFIGMASGSLVFYSNSGLTAGVAYTPTLITTLTSAGVFSTIGAINTSDGYKVSAAAALGQYIRGDGTKGVFSALLAGDMPTSGIPNVAYLNVANQFTLTNTFTIANARAVQAYSGATGSWSSVGVGRTSGGTGIEVDLGISNGSSAWFTGDVAGDAALRVLSSSQVLRLGVGSAYAQMHLANTFVQVGVPLVLGSITGTTHFHPHVASYDSQTTVVGAIIVHTPIVWSDNQMTTVHVRGYFYGELTQVDFSISFYPYSGNTAATNPTNFNFVDRGSDGLVKRVGVDAGGKVAISIGETTTSHYFARIMVDCWTTQSSTTRPTGWVIDTSSTAGFGWSGSFTLVSSMTVPGNITINQIGTGGVQANGYIRMLGTVSNGVYLRYTDATQALTIEDNAAAVKATFALSTGDLTTSRYVSAAGFQVAAAAASGQYLRGDGTKAVFSALLAADMPTSAIPNVAYLNASNTFSAATQAITLAGSGNNPQWRVTENSVTTKMQTLGASGVAWFGAETNHVVIFGQNNNEAFRLGTDKRLSSSYGFANTPAYAAGTIHEHVFFYGSSASWPQTMAYLGDASYVNHYVTLNARVTGGTRTTPTYTSGGGTGGGILFYDPLAALLWLTTVNGTGVQAKSSISIEPVNGFVGIGIAASSSYSMYVSTQINTAKGLVVRAVTSQSGVLQEWQGPGGSPVYGEVDSVGVLRQYGPAASTTEYAARVTGDTVDRWVQTADGTMKWGPGNAAADLTLARIAVGVAQLSGELNIVGQATSTSILVAKSPASFIADYFQLQDSNANVMARFDNVGQLEAYNYSYKQEWGIYSTSTATTFQQVGLALTITQTGTLANPFSNPLQKIQHTSGAVSGNTAGAITSTTFFKAGMEPEFIARIVTDPASVATVRYWVGMTSADLSGIGVLTNQATVAAFRFDTGVGDTHWQAITGDGTSAAATDTGITPGVATEYRLRIVHRASDNAYLFYINGTLVATKTVNAPIITTSMAVQACVTTLTAATRAIGIGFIKLRIN